MIIDWCDIVGGVKEGILTIKISLVKVALKGVLD